MDGACYRIRFTQSAQKKKRATAFSSIWNLLKIPPARLSPLMTSCDTTILTVGTKFPGGSSASKKHGTCSPPSPAALDSLNLSFQRGIIDVISTKYPNVRWYPDRRLLKPYRSRALKPVLYRRHVPNTGRSLICRFYLLIARLVWGNRHSKQER